ncbi:isochorismate synthase [Chryseobacterium ginsenosidimutans]|uniref:chorismate-binding protein n=1 Tax=Chryseobacterium ginsenosidimutans TaxID=687846 RepID=UPI002781E081|nr:chorismate-binding protein [Chryseobacterium ginsenosidimutans]MDQ0593228.1 isochorismate synthase [Chryseobacterium ginsenosidimutans]
MIYFKFPFDEKLYSTGENKTENHIQFYSFDGLSHLNFNGEIVEVNYENFEIVTSYNFLKKDDNEFIAETKQEYLENLEKVIEIIKVNQLPKLVYSRRKIFTDFQQIDLKESFKNLCNSYPNAFRYIFIDANNSWMGAFSEVLGKFNKNTHAFETMSLAGTLPVSENWSEKEIEEQKPVSSYIRNILNTYSENIQESDTYDHISGNIKHLRTDFNAKIKPENLDKIIQELHPTPAVCGIPKDFCKENIQNLEKFPRELYAGYIKIETEETVQYFVNLRCSKLYKDSVHLFVGGGITAQSNPEKEWTETELKSEAVLKNLVILK